MSVGSVSVSESTLKALMRFIEEEISRLKSELKIIEEELRLFEEKYGLRSSEFLEMMEGKRKWSLPDGSEPDVVEWEALIEQKRMLEKRLKELDELWHQLRDYSKY